MKRADDAFGKWIKHRDNYTCRAVDARPDTCQGGYRLQTAHIISRSYKAIRVNPANAVALCSSCHMYYTNYPLEWREWVDGEFGVNYWDVLKRHALTYARQNWKVEAAYWEEACRADIP